MSYQQPTASASPRDQGNSSASSAASSSDNDEQQDQNKNSTKNNNKKQQNSTKMIPTPPSSRKNPSTSDNNNNSNGRNNNNNTARGRSKNGRGIRKPGSYNRNNNDEDDEGGENNNNMNHQHQSPSSARSIQQKEQEEALPFEVEKDEEHEGFIRLPITAFTPRENPREEKRRLQLLEIYWNNSNPSVAGLFSEVEPIDRILSKTHGGAHHLAEGLRNSVLLQDIPRSTLQRQLDALGSKSDQERQKHLRTAAKRAIHRLRGEDTDTDGEDEEEAAVAAERRRKKKEKQLRIEAQDQRREDLRARFFAGEDIALTDRDRMRLGGPGARQARARDGVARSARDMRYAAEARRKAQIEKRMEEEREKQLLAARQRQQRDAENAQERERREYLAQKRAEKLAAQKEEEERIRREKETEAEAKHRRAQAAREAARKKAEEEARKKAEAEAEAEYEKALQRKKSMSHPEPNYKFDGPDGIPVNQRKVYECLEDGEGMLFRVVETDPNLKGKRWHFYNDTDRTTYYVKITFLPPNSVRPLGEAKLEENELDGERGEVVVSLKLPPLATLAFAEGQVKGFTAEIEAEDALMSSASFGSASFGDDQEGQQPMMIPVFKNGAPEAEGLEAPYEVYECFEGEGILYRIVKRNPDDGTQKWWYYNDDNQFGFKITAVFGSKSVIEVLGENSYEKQDDGRHLVKGQVGSLATLPFIRGSVKGFHQDFDVVEPADDADSPTPDRIRVDRSKKLNAKQRRQLIKDLQNRAAEMVEQFRDFTSKQELTTNPSDEPKRLIQALKNRHFFIDLEFPPIMDSVSMDEEQRDALSELCWMKANDLIQDIEAAKAQEQAANAPSAAASSSSKTGGGSKTAGGKAGTSPAPSNFKKGGANTPSIPSLSINNNSSSSASSFGAAKEAAASKPKAQPFLPNSTLEPKDITIGAIADWWVCGAFAVLAHNPFRIKSLFKHHPSGPAVEKKEVSQGIYRVRMLVGGWWQDVVVDDWLPVEIDGKGHPTLFFATSAKGPQELWVSLLEKAIAKTSADRSYTELGGLGESLHILEDFTGFPSVRLDPRLEEEDEESQIALFNDFKTYMERDWIVVLNTATVPEDDDEMDALESSLTGMNLQMDCCYRLVAAADFTDHLGKTRRLVKVSNPWGTGKEWKGNWAWGSNDWKRAPNSTAACKEASNTANSRRASEVAAMVPGAKLVTEGSNDMTKNSNNNNSGGDSMSLSLAIPTIDVGDGSSPNQAAAAVTSPTKKKRHSVSYTEFAKPDQPGTFWIEWSDMKKYFTGAGVCYTQNDWHDYRVKGRFEDGHPSVALEVRCTQTTKAYLLLMQQAESGFDESHPDARYTGAVLSVCSRNDDHGEFETILNSDVYFDKPSKKDYTYVLGRALGCEHTFEPDDQLHLIIPRSYSKTCNKDYVLAVILDQPVGDETISFRFKQLEPEVGIFENYPQFAYSSSVHSKEVAMDFQYRPPNGRPQTNVGFELEGAPSDLIAGRVSRMQGGATPAPQMFGMGSPSLSLSSPAGSASGVYLGGSPSMKQDPVGTFRAVSSMSFETISDVLVHIRNSSELPFEVNAIGVYDFRGIEVFRSTQKFNPPTRKPSWAHVDQSVEGGMPLGYLWNQENKNLTFKLLKIDVSEEDGSETVTPMCEGKTTWDDATVAAKLSNEKDGKRPIVALRLRTVNNNNNTNSSGNNFGDSTTNGLNSSVPNLGNTATPASFKREVIGTMAVSFSAISRVTEESQVSYFSITFDSCSRVMSSDSTKATKLSVFSGKTNRAIYHSGESMQATPKEDMFMGSQSECVIHNHHHASGYIIQLAEFEKEEVNDNQATGTVLAELKLTTQQLTELSGETAQKRIDLENKVSGKFDDDKPFVKCRVQAFRWDNF